MNSHHEKIKLTAAELSYMWTTYLSDSMSICILQYFLKHIEDNEIKSLIERALKVSIEHIEFIDKLFTVEKIKIPEGFTKSDVNLEAKRLFSDTFYLDYLKNMTKGGLVTYGRMLQHSFRQDIRSFLSTNCLANTIKLDEESTRLLLEKGVAVRPPYIPYPQKVEFVHKQSFILEGLGRREVLTGTEVTHLYTNILSNYLGSSLATAFSQVAKSNKVRQYFLRGKEISLKHAKVLARYLELSSLPIPMSTEQDVSESREAPFSDKLMMFHFNLMIYTGIANYGVAIAESQRTDLVVDYSRLNAEILKYSEDGANIMIANEWLEQPPLAANRKDLVKD